MKTQFSQSLRIIGAQHGAALLGLFVSVLLLHDVFGAHGFLAMQRTRSNIKKVRAEIQTLSKENAALEQMVKDLKTDPHAIEKIAREDMTLAKPGEIIIKIPQALWLTQAAATRP